MLKKVSHHFNNKLLLSERETHLWICNLSSTAVDYSEIDSLLSPKEKATVAKFQDISLEKRYYYGRYYLRTVLSFYLNCAPYELLFKSNEQGKPYLAPLSFQGLHTFHFNMSHSEEVLVVAISKDNEVGVDIEKMDLHFNVEEVSYLTLTQRETAKLLSIQDFKARAKEFFRIWTCKEAFLKATGSGLSYSPAKVEILSADNYEDQNTVVPWKIITFYEPDSYVCSLATHVKADKLVFYRFEGTSIQLMSPPSLVGIYIPKLLA